MCLSQLKTGIWPHPPKITASVVNVPNGEECFVVKARREALEADLVVVNHHLFFADVALKEEGMAELLPNCNTVIFDERISCLKPLGYFLANDFEF